MSQVSSLSTISLMSKSNQLNRDALSKETESNRFVLAAIGTTFLAILGSTFPFVSMQLRSPLPYMATPRYKVEKALGFLLERKMISDRQFKSNIHKNVGNMVKRANNTRANSTQARFVDLGSGDGTTIFAAAALSWKSTGIELNPTLWAISSIRRMFQPIDIRNDCTFIHGDMFKSTRLKHELNQADCVMVFGVNSLMPRIADLIEKECQSNVFVMSYRFRVPLLKRIDLSNANGIAVDDKIIQNESTRGVIDASLIYEEEEMRVYRMHKSEGKY